MRGLIALDFLFATTIFVLILARVALILSCCRKHIAHAETSAI
jgi:hypothetical protein